MLASTANMDAISALATGSAEAKSANPRATRRPRVLAIAEAANPEWVSVPLVGWNLASTLRAVADVHLITQVRNREALLRAGLTEGEDFTAIDSERVARPVHALVQKIRGGAGRGWTTSMALSVPAYYYFEWRIWQQFGASLRRGDWDLVHRITPLSPTLPSPLVYGLRRAGVPFVIGPLNGGVPWPAGFNDARHAEREWLSYVRGAHRLLPGYEATRAAAAGIIIGSRDTLAQLALRHRDRVVYIPENGVNIEQFAARLRPTPELPLRLCFVGRLVPYKGAHMLLDAAEPLLRSGKVLLDIIGDGPEWPDMVHRVRQAGLEHAVSLPGWADHATVSEYMRRADLFVFPSVREFGGGVVLEAMACGTPPVVLDYGGPSELVSESSGVRVPIGSRAEIVTRFRRVLERFVASPESLVPMSRAAQERVARWYTWERKAQQVRCVYDWVLGASARPDFGTPFPD